MHDPGAVHLINNELSLFGLIVILLTEPINESVIYNYYLWQILLDTLRVNDSKFIPKLSEQLIVVPFSSIGIDSFVAVITNVVPTCVAVKLKLSNTSGLKVFEIVLQLPEIPLQFTILALVVQVRTSLSPRHTGV